MATGPGFASGTNTFIPNWEASGRLAMGYSRNVKKFHLPKYCQYVKSPRTVGYYLKLSPQEAARVVSLNDYRWARGQPRPTRTDGLEQFNWIEFRTERFDMGFNIDDDSEQQAEWGVVEQHAQIHAAKAMTLDTIQALTTLTTTSNWQTTADPDLSANHTATAASLAGGYLDQGTSTTPFIKIALDKIAALVNLDTIGVVESDLLQVIINPNTARLMAESPEIHEYLKGSPDALAEIRMGQKPNGKYGLPSSLYGYPILVENCVKITSRKNDTLVKAYAFPDQTLAVVSRVGELEGVYEMPSFSTLTRFWHKDDFTLERFSDPKNRLTEAHVVIDDTFALTSPLSGYLLTSATSVAS